MTTIGRQMMGRPTGRYSVQGQRNGNYSQSFRHSITYLPDRKEVAGFWFKNDRKSPKEDFPKLLFESNAVYFAREKKTG